MKNIRTISVLCLSVLAIIGGVFLARYVRPAPEIPAAPAISQTLASAATALNDTTISASFDGVNGTLACEQSTRYTNRTGDTLSHLQFRLYANTFKREGTTPAVLDDFHPGEVFITAAKVNDQSVAWSVQGTDESVLNLALTLAPSESAQITLTYTLRIPEAAWRYGYQKGTYLMGNAFPIPAVYQDSFFRADAYGTIGDPFISESQNITLTLTLPDGYEAAASGTRSVNADGSITFTAVGVRDMALAFSTSYKQAHALHGDTLISAYTHSQKDADTTLRLAKKALTAFESLFGVDYPYPTLTFAQGNLGSYGGMEYSSMAILSDSAYEASTYALELILVHETAHQWFGALVGSDQVNEAWLDEATAQYATLLYFEKEHGSEAFDELYLSQVEPALRITRPFGVTTGASLENFLTISEYSQTVYHRGAGMLHGIREATSLEMYCEFMKLYLTQNAYKIATREDFLSALLTATGSSWIGYLNDYLDS